MKIDRCNRGVKQGIAECDQEEIVNTLKPYLRDKSIEKSGVLLGKSLKIELSDSKLRNYLSQKFHLGKCNNKSFFRRIETLQIEEGNIEKAIEEYHNGN